MTSREMAMAVSFGDFAFDPERRQLLRLGEPVPLETKAYELLGLLLSRRPTALSKEQIRSVLWPGTFVSESALARLVTQIRAACGDDAQNPRFIRTVHGFGYAFCGEARESADERPAAGDEGREAAAARCPYPGLSPFVEEDAAWFFGREAEVEALWEKLRLRNLLAVIGPSGAGKTSFVRAGVLPARPEGWATLVCTPGRAPMRALARALAPELAGDTEALTQLPDFEELEVAVSLVTKWRRGHDEALIVLDQFEELFTQSPPEAQERFAQLIGRLTKEADVHVLLSLRDDFLMRCHEHEPLVSVFTELTPLGALSRPGLHRAVTEPAKSRGSAFEDDALVDEMLDAVEGVRGTLPLLAFAVSRLWEKRDRERELLTRETYEEIGGVAGALAQHAEQTLERIGSERQGMVREIFRNLVTSQGTRASSDREELLSVFPERETAEEVLRELIGARLLTSYEVAEAAGALVGEEADAAPQSRHRVEIVHESLIQAWPRLVWWQAQDEEGAHLRDQLKQAAHLWAEKDRSPDLLWSGTAFREFELWRERYPGKLTALEEDFSRSMIARARRRKRRRRLVAASVVAAAVVVASVTGLLWRRSEAARERAAAEARRAEASKLLALAQARLDEDPTEALALTTASLELADTPEARLFAMKTLWEGPPALELAGEGTRPSGPTFSPDGRWLAAAGMTEEVGVWARTGELVARLPGHPIRGRNMVRWAPGGLLVAGASEVADRVHLWSLPSGERVRTIEFGGPSRWQMGRGRLFAQTLEVAAPGSVVGYRGIHVLRSWALPDGEARELGRFDFTALGVSSSWFEPSGAGWLHTKGRTLYMRPLPADGGGDLVVSRHNSPVHIEDVHAQDFLGTDGVVVREDSGRLHSCCSFSEGRPTLAESFPMPATADEPAPPEPSGRWLAQISSVERRARLWRRADWPGARPLELRRRTSWYSAGHRFDPTGDWLVADTTSMSRLTFWPLRRPYPTVVDGYSSWFLRPLAFAPDSRSLVTSWADGTLRLWPVGEDMQQGPRVLDLPETGTDVTWSAMVFDSDGQKLFVVGYGLAYVVSLDGSPARRLEGFTYPFTAAFSPSGRRVATASGYGEDDKMLRVWDLDTGEVRSFDLPESVSVQGGEPIPEQGGLGRLIASLAFAGESALYSSGPGGIRRWDLDEGSHELVFAAHPGLIMRMDAEGRTALVRRGPDQECLPAELVDVEAGTSRALPAFGDCIQHTALALDPSGRVAATGDRSGLLRVGRLDGGEPHVLFGHVGLVQGVAISPDLRWVASTGEDDTLRLWPMPDLDEPPLHTLPHDELLAKVHSLTNLRAVRNPESPTGWTIELGPFPGWKEVPTW